jgi:hypothetical protein
MTHNLLTLRQEEKLVFELVKTSVLFVGRSLYPEYVKMFDLKLDTLLGKRILDVASGPASFTCEMCKLGYDVIALDMMYSYSVSELRLIANNHLESFFSTMPEDHYPKTDQVMAWLDENLMEEVNTPIKLRGVRERGLQLFLEDFDLDANRQQRRYVAGSLPAIESVQDQLFDLILVGNLLFAYSQKQEYNYDFHISSIRSLASRLNDDGELRIYPFGNDDTFSFPCQKLRDDLLQEGIDSQSIESEHRYVKGWTQMLVVKKLTEASSKPH